MPNDGLPETVLSRTMVCLMVTCIDRLSIIELIKSRLRTMIVPLTLLWAMVLSITVVATAGVVVIEMRLHIDNYARRSEHPQILDGVMARDHADDVKGKGTAAPSTVTSGVSSPFTSPLSVVCPPHR